MEKEIVTENGQKVLVTTKPVDPIVTRETQADLLNRKVTLIAQANYFQAELQKVNSQIEDIDTSLALLAV